MSVENIDLFVHREGVPPKAVRAAGDEPLTEVLKRAGLEPSPGLHVFVGESVSALDEANRDIEDGEDAHESVNPATTLVELGISRSGHVHCHRCHRVAVTVHYQQHTAHRRFSPAATVGTATAWAHHRFKITDTDKVNFVLQVCDSDRRPRPDEHLGELVHAPDCNLCFDLVPEKKIEG